MAAALDCAEAGCRVTLLEARTRLGGATWSTERDGLWIDNGQHVFLRCCTAYTGFLERLGVMDRVYLQRRLALPVRSPMGGTHWLRRQALPAPLHLARSLLAFGHLGLAERLKIVRTVMRLGRLDLADTDLDRRSFGVWLEEQGEDPRSIDRFWDLLIRPTVNAPARDASLTLAAKVFQTGLLEASGNADIGWSRVPLQSLHGDAAARALDAHRADVRLRSRVEAVRGGSSPAVRVAGDWIDADAVVFAATHEDAASLLPPEAGLDPTALQKLGRSPIVNLHVVFDRRVTEQPLLAGIDSPIEWIFDRTDSSGLRQGQYLAITLSAADAWVGMGLDALRERLLPELLGLLPAAREANLERFFSTCERAATFHQVPGTRALRPGARTASEGLFLAGAWTDTGWPATMEGAVRSGRAAAGAALESLHQPGRGNT
jgi:squalene-associated FAD-dependent desaturase